MKYLAASPEVAAGHLVIKGTRIRIAHVFKLIADGMSLQDIHADWYPWLPVATLRGAVTEASEHISISTHAESLS
jgi:uncharacterized protein (DUF433 family)